MFYLSHLADTFLDVSFLSLHINPLQMQAACNWIIHLCFPSCSLTLFLSESQDVSVSRIRLQYNPASSTEYLAVKSRLEGRELPVNLFKLCCLASGDMPYQHQLPFALEFLLCTL